MMNKPFHVFAGLLAHPLALGGMALLTLNDLVFQRLAPSWLTGKLSDFAWFLFAPYLLAALIALILPRRLRNEKVAGGLAFGLALAGFTAVKTIPVVHQSVLHAALSSGLTLKLVFDPGDLAAALSGSMLSLLIWLKPRLTPIRTSRASLAIMAVSAVLIAADMTMPNPGISCLEAGDGFLKAADWASIYVSSDGGLSWQESELFRGQMCAQANGSGQPIPVIGAEELRYTPGQTVERSSDGGRTWQVIHPFKPLAEADREYYLLRSSAANNYLGDTPLAALKDPQTGNVVFAMGHEGVLVYTAVGEWRWASVGPYAFERGLTFKRLFNLLASHLLVGLLLAGLAFGSLSLPFRQVWWKWLLLIPAGLLWLILAFSMPSSFQTGYAIAAYGLIPCALLTGLLLVFVLNEGVNRYTQVLPWMGLWGVACGAAYLLGPLLWSLGILAKFNTASLLGLALAVALLIWGFTHARQTARASHPSES